RVPAATAGTRSCASGEWRSSLGRCQCRATAVDLRIGPDRRRGGTAEPCKVGGAVLLCLFGVLRPGTPNHVPEVPHAGTGREEPVPEALAALVGQGPERIELRAQRRNDAVELRRQVAQEL